MTRSIEQLKLENFLSYGSPGAVIDLLPLNVLVGPNGSGKSNLIEALAILRATAGDLASAFRAGGGIGEYVRKVPDGREVVSIQATVLPSDLQSHLRYGIDIARVGAAPEVVREYLREPVAVGPKKTMLERVVYDFNNGKVRLARRHLPNSEPTPDELRLLNPQDLERDQSILSQRRDPELYPEITSLADLFIKIAIYQEWTFGAQTKSRLPQGTDLPTDFLRPDGSNLALVLNDLLKRSTTRNKLVEYLQRFYAAAQHISTTIQGGTVQLFIEESDDVLVPATRLSDGTLRYLSLLAILCHPSPPPIVCIEEPELGLHPDILPTIAELLLDASQRTQLIVTTHSDALVSALSDTPECIVVCEPGENGTELRRLDKDALAEWLSRYSLGELWRMGEIGGTRW